LGLSAGLDFETKLIARPELPDRLAKELSAKGYHPSPIAIGSNTDPYQPVEVEQGIMRRTLLVLQEFNHPVTIATKGVLIERDIDILADMAARNLVRVGISVTTLDATLSRQMEPRVPLPKRRLTTIRRLSAAGVPVRVMASPMIPGLTDRELEAILTEAKGAGATAATWILLRLPFEVSTLFREWLQEHVPDRAARVIARIREAHGGQDYDAEWGKRMRGEGAYAEMIAQRFKVAVKRLELSETLPELRCDLFKRPQRVGDQLSLF
jgi:DNA repair photolyase